MTKDLRVVALRVSAAVSTALVLLPACSSTQPPPPAVAAGRKVLLEIDRMAGTPPLQLEQTINGARVSLKAMYAEAGIDLDIRQDQVDLPRQDDVSLADLHAMMTAFRSVEAPPDVMRVHALVLTTDREDPETLGIMFDDGNNDVDARPREGFAVFANPHSSLAGGRDAELLLTMAHELGHCFNLHHPDWEGESFKRGATIESYSQADSARWSLSSHSKAHIRSDPGREVWPGSNNIAFRLVTEAHLARHNAVPGEKFFVVDPASFNLRRPIADLGASLRAIAKRGSVQLLAADQHPVKLGLEAPKRSYVAGEAVTLTVGLHNTGTTNQFVYPLLDPKFSFLNIEIRGPGQSDFDAFQPVVVADARGAKPEPLAPGASLHELAPIFFGADGWVFTRPGEYVIRADYPAPSEEGRTRDESERIRSAELTIAVTEPATSAARRVKEVVLGNQEGLYLVLGGADHLKEAASRLRKVAQEAPGAPQSASIKLVLGKAALNPTTDVSTGVQSQPRVDEAKQYLDAVQNAPLPALSVAEAQADLAEALDDKGRKAEAARVRTRMQRMRAQESAKEYIDEVTRPSKTQESARPSKR